MKMAESSPNGKKKNKKKTLWEKEKLLVTSNFSLSHNVYKRLVLHTLKNQDLFGKGFMYLRVQQMVRENNEFMKP